MASTLDGVEAEVAAVFRGRGRPQPRSPQRPPSSSSSGTASSSATSSPGGRHGRCSAGPCWCRARASRPRRCRSMLRALGAEPVEVPTIAVEPPRTPAPMERALQGPGRRALPWVAFTRANAVKAMREKLEESGSTPAPSPASRSPPSARRPPPRCAPSGCGPTWCRAGQQSSEGLLEVWPPCDEHARPARPGAAAPGRHRHRDAGRRAEGPRLVDRRPHRLPHRAGRAAARAGPRGAQGPAASTRCCSPPARTVRNLVGIAGKPHESTVHRRHRAADRRRPRRSSGCGSTSRRPAGGRRAGEALADFAVARARGRGGRSASSPTAPVDVRRRRAQRRR